LANENKCGSSLTYFIRVSLMKALLTLANERM